MEEENLTHNSLIVYPTITVKPVGEDGNAFAILGKCTKAMRRARLPQAEIDAFMAEATAGSYDQLLQTALRWFDVE
jgi:hypothetical protein